MSDVMKEERYSMRAVLAAVAVVIDMRPAKVMDRSCVLDWVK